MPVINICFTLDDNDNIVSVEPGYGWDYFQMQSITVAMPRWFEAVLKGTRSQPRGENADGGSTPISD